MKALTPHSLAGGFALGAAVAVTPFVGAHLVLAALLAWWRKINVFAAAAGTLLVNPWTGVYVWVGTKHLGHLMTGRLPHRGDEYMDFPAVFDGFWSAVVNLDFAPFAQAAAQVWLPMLLGSLPVAGLVWCAFYFPLRRVMARYVPTLQEDNS